ncbi:hypothetical protein A0H81_11285 [Grifola frondosa]|uniref:Uncharacterized protein n=1 Tax=Grifola frondosa TaxID=5627 RepID=A0A1C7LW74_GRIFR|nr:hypothetical protein A0H81_11285 [Grifola frondosa]
MAAAQHDNTTVAIVDPSRATNVPRTEFADQAPAQTPATHTQWNLAERDSAAIRNYGATSTRPARQIAATHHGIDGCAPSYDAPTLADALEWPRCLFGLFPR